MSDPAVESPVVHVLADRIRIAITGDDRHKWLNGMVTCDLAPFATAQSPRAAYGCVLNVKGKVLADAIVVTDEGRLGAWVPRSTAGTVLELWNKYIIMEDCEVAIDDARALVSVQGAGAEPLIASLSTEAFALHAAPLDELGIGGGIVVEVAPSEVEGTLATLVGKGAQRIDDEQVRALRIGSARAAYGDDIDDHNYVQEAGLQVRAVSFNKGCYVGQEVVCMLEMRGKVHRRLVQVALPESASASKGLEVKAGDDVVGSVTSVTKREGRTLALAMVKTASSELGMTLHIGEAKGEVVAVAS